MLVVERGTICKYFACILEVAPSTWGKDWRWADIIAQAILLVRLKETSWQKLFVLAAFVCVVG